MKKFNKKYITLIILAIMFFTILVISIILFNFNTSSKSATNQEIVENNNDISTTNTSSNLLIVPLENEKEEEEEKIYGYDENAMQVASSYNGFPACGFIEIPKTSVSLPVLSNQTVSGMEYSCCMLYSTGTINLSGNTYIVGHNYDNGTLFSNNKNLTVGDKIILTGLYKNRLEYTIYNIFNTTPEDTSYLTRTVDEKT